MSRLALTIVLLASCRGGDSLPVPSELVRVDGFELEVPLDWQRTDLPRDRASAVVWAPAVNPRKESIMLIHSRFPSAAEVPDAVEAEELIAATQKVFARARTSPLSPVTTQGGFKGTRIDVDFEKGSASYHRIHVVLRDQANKTDLVHVLYTAQQPDPNAIPLELVLETLRRGES
jgi:hypothetical protein